MPAHNKNGRSLHTPTSTYCGSTFASRRAFSRKFHHCHQLKGFCPCSIAQTLVVPAGRTANAVSVLTSPLATCPTVPSPPMAKTAS
jgi:hypothetical protein